MDAYERVLGDAMAGDATLFAREDYVEEAWRIVDPVLKAGTPVYEYEPGTWGPREVDAHVAPPRRLAQPGRDGVSRRWQRRSSDWRDARSKCSPTPTPVAGAAAAFIAARRGRPWRRAAASCWR